MSNQVHHEYNLDIGPVLPCLLACSISCTLLTLVIGITRPYSPPPSLPLPRVVVHFLSIFFLYFLLEANSRRIMKRIQTCVAARPTVSQAVASRQYCSYSTGKICHDCGLLFNVNATCLAVHTILLTAPQPHAQLIHIATV